MVSSIFFMEQVPPEGVFFVEKFELPDEIKSRCFHIFCNKKRATKSGPWSLFSICCLEPNFFFLDDLERLVAFDASRKSMELAYAFNFGFKQFVFIGIQKNNVTFL